VRKVLAFAGKKLRTRNCHGSNDKGVLIRDCSAIVYHFLDEFANTRLKYECGRNPNSPCFLGRPCAIHLQPNLMTKQAAPLCVVTDRKHIYQPFVLLKMLFLDVAMPTADVQQKDHDGDSP